MRRVEQALRRKVILTVYLIGFKAVRYLGQLRGQSTPSRAYLQDSLAIPYRGELDDPLDDPIVSQIVLTETSPLHFLMNRLILDPPESSSTIRLARSLAGSLSPTLCWISSKLLKGCLSLPSTICFMNVFPMPGISSRPCSLGVSGCNSLKYAMYFDSLDFTILSTTPRRELFDSGVSSSKESLPRTLTIFSLPSFPILTLSPGSKF